MIRRGCPDMQIKELELRFREAVKELKVSRPA
jgi:hypothetical protein